MKVNFITMQSLTELLKSAFSLIAEFVFSEHKRKSSIVNKFFTFLLTNKNAQMHIYIQFL